MKTYKNSHFFFEQISIMIFILFLIYGQIGIHLFGRYSADETKANYQAVQTGMNGNYEFLLCSDMYNAFFFLWSIVLGGNWHLLAASSFTNYAASYVNNDRNDPNIPFYEKSNFYFIFNIYHLTFFWIAINFIINIVVGFLIDLVCSYLDNQDQNIIAYHKKLKDDMEQWVIDQANDGNQEILDMFFPTTANERGAMDNKLTTDQKIKV